MDIQKLVDQKKIKSVDQLLAMGPSFKDFTELYIQDEGVLHVLNPDQIGTLKQFKLYYNYLNS